MNIPNERYSVIRRVTRSDIKMFMYHARPPWTSRPTLNETISFFELPYAKIKSINRLHEGLISGLYLELSGDYMSVQFQALDIILSSSLAENIQTGLMVSEENYFLSDEYYMKILKKLKFIAYNAKSVRTTIFENPAEIMVSNCDEVREKDIVTNNLTAEFSCVIRYRFDVPVTNMPGKLYRLFRPDSKDTYHRIWCWIISMLKYPHKPLRIIMDSDFLQQYQGPRKSVECKRLCSYCIRHSSCCSGHCYSLKDNNLNPYPVCINDTGNECSLPQEVESLEFPTTEPTFTKFSTRPTTEPTSTKFSTHPTTEPTFTKLSTRPTTKDNFTETSTRLTTQDKFTETSTRPTTQDKFTETSTRPTTQDKFTETSTRPTTEIYMLSGSQLSNSTRLYAVNEDNVETKNNSAPFNTFVSEERSTHSGRNFSGVIPSAVLPTSHSEKPFDPLLTAVLILFSVFVLCSFTASLFFWVITI